MKKYFFTLLFLVCGNIACQTLMTPSKELDYLKEFCMTSCISPCLNTPTSCLYVANSILRKHNDAELDKKIKLSSPEQIKGCKKIRTYIKQKLIRGYNSISPGDDIRDFNSEKEDAISLGATHYTQNSEYLDDIHLSVTIRAYYCEK